MFTYLYDLFINFCQKSREEPPPNYDDSQYNKQYYDTTF